MGHSQINLPDLISIVSTSMSHAPFSLSGSPKSTLQTPVQVLTFFRLSDLVQQYQKLMYCELPIRYFNQNFNPIKQVCEKDPSKWQ